MIKCAGCSQVYPEPTWCVGRFYCSGCIVKVCIWCGEKLTDEELQGPAHNTDGEVICDTCRADEYMDTCPLCEDYYAKSEQVAGALFLVLDPDYAEPGVYRSAKSWIEWEWIDSDAEKVSSWQPDKEIDGDFYPAAWICSGCVEKVGIK